MRTTKPTMEQRAAITRLVDISMVEGATGIVGPGDKREGTRGTQIAVIGRRHHSGYETMLQLDDAKSASLFAACTVNQRKFSTWTNTDPKQ